MSERVWTCQRISAGVKCSHENPRRKWYCQACGKKRPETRKPSHLDALELTYEQYIEINGGDFCGICGVKPKPGKKLHRDHDHRSGKPRGLLCFPDNSALRPYMDADWLRRTLAYVERTEVKS